MQVDIYRNPVSAAKKAFNKFCRQKKIKGVCTLNVTVKETTQGSKGKEFTYKLHKKLKEPLIMMEGTNNEYVIEYTVEAKSLKSQDPCRRKGQTRGRMSKRTKKKSRLSGNNDVRRRRMRSLKSRKRR